MTKNVKGECRFSTFQTSLFTFFLYMCFLCSFLEKERNATKRNIVSCYIFYSVRVSLVRNAITNYCLFLCNAYQRE